MKVVALIFLLSCGTVFGKTEVKKLNPENANLSKRLLNLLGPEKKSKVHTRVLEERPMDLGLTGGTNRVMNLKAASDSHI